jgi:mRNA interferase RelE/StbE
MSYEIMLKGAARRQLDVLSERDYQKVAGVISGLAQNPRPPKVKKLSDSGLWRVRIGHFRVVYAIDDAARLVNIVRVARRKEDTYRRL